MGSRSRELFGELKHPAGWHRKFAELGNSLAEPDPSSGGIYYVYCQRAISFSKRALVPLFPIPSVYFSFFFFIPKGDAHPLPKKRQTKTSRFQVFHNAIVTRLDLV